MNYARFLLGAAAVAAGVWIVVGEQLSGASADAVVNAGLSTLRAPIAGTATLPPRALGSRVIKGEELGGIKDPIADTIHLNDLLLDRDLAKADLAKTTALITATKARTDALTTQAKSDSAERLAELQYTIDGLNAQLAADTARLTAIEARLTAEQLRTNRLAATRVASTVNGILWEYLAADGETLQRGQDVIRLVDCDSAIVTLSVSENVYRRLTAGQAAQFRLSGESKVYPGTITRLAGAGAATIYSNLAVAPNARHLERYDVTLLVPALRDQPDLRCMIGRTGRVFFDSRPLDDLRSLWN